MERYPAWVLAIAIVAWSGTIFVSTWFATRLGKRIPGIAVALLLLLAVVFNVSMLPYSIWFKVVMLACAPVACLLGISLPSRQRMKQVVETATAE